MNPGRAANSAVWNVIFRRASFGRTLLSSGGGRSKVVMVLVRSSSYFGGSSGRGYLGCLKNSVCGEAASVHCGNLSVRRTNPRIVASSIRAPQSAGPWSTLSPTSPNGQSVSDLVSLGKSSTSHTILVHNESDRLVRVAVGTVCALSKIVHEG